jgi:hypothetical protein
MFTSWIKRTNEANKANRSLWYPYVPTITKGALSFIRILQSIWNAFKDLKQPELKSLFDEAFLVASSNSKSVQKQPLLMREWVFNTFTWVYRAMTNLYVEISVLTTLDPFYSLNMSIELETSVFSKADRIDLPEWTCILKFCVSPLISNASHGHLPLIRPTIKGVLTHLNAILPGFWAGVKMQMDADEPDANDDLDKEIRGEVNLRAITRCYASLLNTLLSSSCLEVNSRVTWLLSDQVYYC